MCTLRPMVQPRSASACRNAPTQALPSASSATAGRSTPIRRIRSGCCARRKRPGGGRAAEECDELAPFQSSNCICRPSQGLPWQHTALARIKLGAHCSAGSDPAHDRSGSFASLRRAARLRRMSAMPSMATESVRRNEPTRCAKCRHPGWHLRSLRLRLGEADRRSMRRGQISTSPNLTERRKALLICKSVSHQKSLKGT